MDADIVCVGFGPATAGFLATLSKQLVNADGTPAVESAVMPGMPPQVLCYERADDIGFGVSGVVTRGAGVARNVFRISTGRHSDGRAGQRGKSPLSARPARREPALGGACALADCAAFARSNGCCRSSIDALNLPWTPAFLHKHGGMVLSMGQFMQWVGAQVQSTGTVQIWPGTPVAEVLIENGTTAEAKLAASQRSEELATAVRAPKSSASACSIKAWTKKAIPSDGFTPGMDIHAALTVVGDGPVGPIGRQLDEHFGMPRRPPHARLGGGHEVRGGSAGDTPLKPGTVLHTFGYPEPEIFGFLYVHPDRVASLGIFVPSWFDSPVRTAYRYLQHWMLHPYLWRYLKGGKLRSWGAKTLGESGKRGEPHLVGDGYARIGEGSGSTNVLTGSGVDEAWATGTQLAEAVLELLKAKKPFTRQNLEETYVKRRRASWVEAEGRVAEKSRDGFQKGVVRGMIGMALAGLTNGKFSLGGEPVPAVETHSDAWKSITPAAFRRDEIAQAARGVQSEKRFAARRAHGQGRLAGDSVRRPVARVASGRAADGRQGAGAARLRRPRRFPVPRTLREMRREDLHRAVQRPGDYARRKRRAGFRPREMRPLRRVPVELRAGQPGKSRAHEHRLPRRHRRLALGGELTRTTDGRDHHQKKLKNESVLIRVLPWLKIYEHSLSNRRLRQHRPRSAANV